MCVCVCVRERERERESQSACLCIYTPCTITTYKGRGEPVWHIVYSTQYIARKQSQQQKKLEPKHTGGINFDTKARHSAGTEQGKR